MVPQHLTGSPIMLALVLALPCQFVFQDCYAMNPLTDRSRPIDSDMMIEPPAVKVSFWSEITIGTDMAVLRPGYKYCIGVCTWPGASASSTHRLLLTSPALPTMFIVIALLAVAATEAVAAPVLRPTGLKPQAISPIGLLVGDFMSTSSLARPSPTDSDINGTIHVPQTTTTTGRAIPVASASFDYAAHAVGAAGIAPSDVNTLQGSKAHPTAQSGAPDSVFVSAVQPAPTSAPREHTTTAHLSTVGLADIPVASLAPPRIGTVEFPGAGPS